ncbi:hypothetical protein BV22DRAFT_1002090 [Leucogyrophana mollusca]|uniref:Uncharacterized protein n=1 Tax=Leucogyrophana mollusca TaxID=85980 RepID=A0ACB8BW54_9AGAM|nr:hypothetical protein BV22DRAFT_1002090 [Leucogyrophana mollusca]
MRSTDQTTNNAQFADPRPDHLRALVLDYLCHSCYTKTARAFARDSAVRHLDADGDEIMSSNKELQGGAMELTDDELEKIQLRNHIRTQILSGRVDEALALLNEHFLSVLSETEESDSEIIAASSTSSERDDYIRFSTVEPVHLSLNLRILGFIEACRTVPLEYNPLGSTSAKPVSYPPTRSSYPGDLEADETRLLDLLSRARKLEDAVRRLSKPSDKASYTKELANVSGLLAYKVPEASPMSKYLHQERRDRVADQINIAILHRNNLPAVSHLELGVKYTTALWAQLHDLRFKPPPISARPSGIKLPPFKDQNVTTSDADSPAESLPAFDLRQFLDVKT